jgi:biopolymer transport protein ExbD
MRYFETRKARIEIIPMIDIVFFLLVFFVMITLRMIPSTGVASQLPQSSTAETLDHPSVVVTLMDNGDIEVDQQRLSLQDLTARLAGQPEPGKAMVTIAGAKTATLQSLLSVMDACRTAGITQIGVAAQEAH